MNLPQLQDWVKRKVPWFRAARRAVLRLGRRAAIRHYLHSTDCPGIHLGCGGNLHSGWLNTDLEPSFRTVVPLNVTQRFPFRDHTFDRVFSEHMIEHLDFAAAGHMLAECHRELRPGGVIRIATPDLNKVARLCCDSSSGENRAYLEWAMRHNLLPEIGSQQCQVVNSLFYHHGHRFLYDEATLAACLCRAGFTHPRRFDPGQSDNPRLAGLEAHGKVIGEAANRLETLVLEACAG